MALITIIGGGLSGCEAAWQAAKRGCDVVLYEMRPNSTTEAHKTDWLAELVCSNSLGSVERGRASAILKDELLCLDSLVIRSALETSVPAGGALAVNRELFSKVITTRLLGSGRVHLQRCEVTKLPESGIVIGATGPLTSPSLAQQLQDVVGHEFLYFFDAISPIVFAESLDLSAMYFKNRHQQSTIGDYLNVPLSKAEYDEFVSDLLQAETAAYRDFENVKYFEACLPIEELAARGPRTLAFGPMRPVGLEDPRTGRRPYAVLQLRKENVSGTAFNLVGFQTKMKHGDQVRIFRKMPGFQNAEFARLGSMHRNTFLCSPNVLLPSMQLRALPRCFIAGQLTGSEGYVESVATGLWAGLNAVELARGANPLPLLAAESMLGALVRAITDSNKTQFQPTNANLGLLPPMRVETGKKCDRKTRNEFYAEQSQTAMGNYRDSIER